MFVVAGAVAVAADNDADVVVVVCVHAGPIDTLLCC